MAPIRTVTTAFIDKEIVVSEVPGSPRARRRRGRRALLVLLATTVVGGGLTALSATADAAQPMCPDGVAAAVRRRGPARSDHPAAATHQPTDPELARAGDGARPEPGEPVVRTRRVRELGALDPFAHAERSGPVDGSGEARGDRRPGRDVVAGRIASRVPAPGARIERSDVPRYPARRDTSDGSHRSRARGAAGDEDEGRSRD